MSTTSPMPPHDQKIWSNGYNVGLYMAAWSLETANDETKRTCLIEAIRNMLLSDGPTIQEIEAGIGRTPVPNGEQS